MQAIACLPEERAAALSRVAEQERIEELRLRCGEAPSVRIGGAERPLSLAPVTADELRETVSRAARYSVHSYAESMRQGFLPLEGGHRLGLCGTAVAENGSVTGVRRISSLNLRVARQIDALDDIIAPYIGEGAPFSLLVLAPPGCGKTTLVREWVRLVSDAGHTTAVADERGEIAGLAEGVPQFRIGRCTDILEGCTKKQAALMLLKTMSPALVAMDEITSPEDIEAVALCAHCGTAVLAAAHAAGPQRPAAQTALPAAAVARRVRAGADDRAEGRETKLSNGENGGNDMLKLIGSVMIFGSCAALGLNARRELRRRVAAADAMLLALRLMENEITARRTPMPEIIDLLAKNENAVVRQIFSGVRRRMRERSGLSLSYLWCAGMRAAQADAGLGREECGVLCDAANFLGRYDASEQKAAIDTALHRLQMLRELAFAELRDRGSLYRTCGIAAGLLVILVLV